MVWRSKDREVKPADLFHTYLQAIGLDPTDEFDIGGRAVPMADPTGHAVQELLGMTDQAQ